MAADFVPAGAPTDPDERRDLAVESVETGVPGLILRPGHFVWLLLDAAAEIAADAGLQVEDQARFRFRTFGREFHGIAQQDATAATATVTFTITDPADDDLTERVIPAGTQVSIQDRVFSTTDDLTISSGATTGDVEVAAAVVGADGSGLGGTPVLLDPLSYVQSLSMTGVTTGGMDAEPDADYEARLALRLRYQGRPILPRDFAARALEIEGVARALAIDGYKPAVDELQTVTVEDATDGTFTLTYDGQTTAAIDHDATAGAVQTALEALSNVDEGDVVCTGGPLGTAPVVVEFTGTLAGTDVATMTSTDTLTGTGAASSIDTTRTGAAAATSQERTITLALVDENGAATSSGVKTSVQELIESEREVNWLVYVIDPTYTTIDVAATVTIWDGYTASDVEDRCEAAVAAFLDPGTWGRALGGDAVTPPEWHDEPDVRVFELATVLNNVAGVRHVTALTINSGTSDVTLDGPAPLPAVGTTAITVDD